MKKLIIFDLDGTLLNTLDDLADSTNYALEQYGFPSRTIEEVRRFVGNGVGKLMERAVPGGADNPRFGEVLDCFKRHYVDHCMVKTGLYPGIADLLARLKAAGYKVAIVSNKLQGGVDELYAHYFRDTVQAAVGGHQAEGDPALVQVRGAGGLKAGDVVAPEAEARQAQGQPAPEGLGHGQVVGGAVAAPVDREFLAPRCSRSCEQYNLGGGNQYNRGKISTEESL